MRIEVHLHTTLQHQTPHGLERRKVVLLSPGSRLADLLDYLDIPLRGDDLLLVVNGRLAEPGQVLADGDVVHLIPAISGG